VSWLFRALQDLWTQNSDCHLLASWAADPILQLILVMAPHHLLWRKPHIAAQAEGMDCIPPGQSHCLINRGERRSGRACDHLYKVLVWFSLCGGRATQSVRPGGKKTMHSSTLEKLVTRWTNSLSREKHLTKQLNSSSQAWLEGWEGLTCAGTSGPLGTTLKFPLIQTN
jgi:hypothetical protein